MDIIQLNQSFLVKGIKANSFPEGIQTAHDQLRAALQPESGHSFYGISYPRRDGNMEYLAAANQLAQQEQTAALEPFQIRAGSFLAITLPQWSSNIGVIEQIFRQLTDDARIDPQGYCLEEYIGKDTLRCLVPMAAAYQLSTEREVLVNDIRSTFGRLQECLSVFSPDEVNEIPFSGSWTAGQVVEHIIKCGSSIPDHQTTEARRFHDEKVLPVQELFLNFELKFVTAPFLEPEMPTHDQTSLLQTLAQISERHVQKARTSQLEALCQDMELPTFGYLTRYEWLRFILVHTQRHIRQLEGIYRAIRN